MKNKENLFEQKSKSTLIRVFLSSFLVIIFFYVAPIFINFADKNFNLKEYENKTNNVFGKIYEIRGNVASPIQFYLTDSLSNFLRGSLNLNSSAKYDSIYPSIQYIKNDILVLFETINWKYNNETK